MKMISFVISLIISSSSFAQDNAITYPPRAERLRITGYVEMTYDIDKSGKVDNLNITDSYPYGVFESAVKKSAKSWVFEPDKPRRVTKQRVFFK